MGKKSKNPHYKVLDAQTLLIMSAFQKINNFLELKGIEAGWNIDVTTARSSFVGGTGDRCEFRTKVEYVQPPGEAFVFFNYDRGKICETDFTGTPAAELTVEKILEYFKNIFEREL
jgi:hypothetical protein